jgi:hypothetical protein
MIILIGGEQMLALGNQTQEDTDFFIRYLKESMAMRLPALNDAAEREVAAAEALEVQVHEWLQPDELDAVTSTLVGDQKRSRQLLGLIELSIASIERHSQGRSRPSGDAVRAVPRLPEFLSRLGETGHHPPRGSHATSIALACDAEPLTPLGLSGERYFWKSVDESERHLTKAVKNLQPLRTFSLSLNDPDAAWLIDEASKGLEDLLQTFRNFRMPIAKGEEPRLPKFDFARLRQYLPPIVINGVKVNGPNPAHVGSWPRLDFAMGMHDDAYLETVRTRYDVMLPEDISIIEREAKLLSVTSVFDIALQSEIGDWQALDPTEIAAEITNQLPRVVAPLIAYRNLARAAKSLTSVHWAMIQNYVVRATEGLSDDQRRRLPINGSVGVSGRPLEETHHLMTIRRSHTVVERLIDIADVVGKAKKSAESDQSGLVVISETKEIGIVPDLP